MSERKPIIMYSTKWCVDCRRAKRLLLAHNIHYSEIDIEQTEGAADKVMASSGGRRVVPTFDIDGEFFHNPPIAELKKILKIVEREAH